MSTNYKEAPNWDSPEFTNPEPGSNSDSDDPSENTNEETASTFDAIEQALREVAYQLGESESAPDSAERYSRAQAPDIDAVTREYTRSFTELAQRIDLLEKSSQTESLRDEIRGLRQRLVEDKDQFNRALDESVGRISDLSSAIDNLTGNLTSLHDESAQLSRTVEHQLEDLSRRLEIAGPQSEDSDERLQEAVERHTSLIEKNIERLAERFEQTELSRDKKDYAVKQALTALLDKLSADKQQNQTALSEARAAFASEIGEMRHALDASKEIIWERLEDRLSSREANYDDSAPHFGQTVPELAAFENEIEQQFESILDRLNAEKQQNADSLAEVRDALASSVGEMKQGLEATERLVERTLETRLLSVDASLEDITRRLDQSERPGAGDNDSLENVIQSMSHRLEQLEQERDASSLRIDEAAEEINRRLEQMEHDNAAVQPLNVIVSDINRRLEKMERAGSEDGGAFPENMESMSHRLEQMERERNANVQSINAIVGEIGRRLEKMETDTVSKLSLFEQSIADLKVEHGSQRKQNEEAQIDLRGAQDEPPASLGGSAPGEQSPVREPAFESTSPIQAEDHRLVADIIQELTASQSMEDPQFGASWKPELPETAEQVGGSIEDLATIVPPSFAMPQIDPTASRSPSMGEVITGGPYSKQRLSDEKPSDARHVLIEDEGYLSGESMAMMGIADEVNLNDVPNAPLKPSAEEKTDLKKKLTFPLKNGLTKLRAAAQFAFQKQNRLATIGAAILLAAGAGVFLFAREQGVGGDTGIADVDPALLAREAATGSFQTGPSLATDEGFVGSATAANPALPIVEVQGPAIRELTPAALRASAPGAPAMLENLIMQANEGSSSAALLLGLIYLNGDGVEANVNIAFWWLRLAAEQGEPIAQNSLGSLYERGQGVDADAAEAAFWYAQAAESGNVVAMHNLAIAHTDGAGVEVDLAEAARLFEDAANFGLADSQFNLAVLYSRGMGVPVSQSEAYKWYLIAAEQGDPEAGAQAEALAGQLAPTERDAAEAEAAAFVPRPRIEAANTLPDLAQIR